MAELDQLRFPIGTYQAPETYTTEQLHQWIASIRTFPERVVALVSDLNDEALAWRYRPNGWNIRQVVHHCADSHMNSLVRFKLALTEETPTIRPYFEDRWALLPDTRLGAMEDVLLLLKGLHARWTTLLEQLTLKDLERTFVHPEHGQSFSLQETIGNYAWHGEHHLAHIQQALEAAGTY